MLVLKEESLGLGEGKRPVPQEEMEEEDAEGASEPCRPPEGYSRQSRFLASCSQT